MKASGAFTVPTSMSVITNPCGTWRPATGEPASHQVSRNSTHPGRNGTPPRRTAPHRPSRSSGRHPQLRRPRQRNRPTAVAQAKVATKRCWHAGGVHRHGSCNSLTRVTNTPPPTTGQWTPTHPPAPPRSRNWPLAAVASVAIAAVVLGAAALIVALTRRRTAVQPPPLERPPSRHTPQQKPPPRTKSYARCTNWQRGRSKSRQTATTRRSQTLPQSMVRDASADTEYDPGARARRAHRCTCTSRSIWPSYSLCDGARPSSVAVSSQ